MGTPEARFAGNGNKLAGRRFCLHLPPPAPPHQETPPGSWEPPAQHPVHVRWAGFPYDPSQWVHGDMSPPPASKQAAGTHPNQGSSVPASPPQPREQRRVPGTPLPPTPHRVPRPRARRQHPPAQPGDGGPGGAEQRDRGCCEGGPGGEAAAAGQVSGCWLRPAGEPRQSGDPGDAPGLGTADPGTHPGTGEEKRTRGCTGA